MTDKIYKVILLGKIAKGYDVEEAQDKLSLILDIDDLKKIQKLLKKPTIIRKNLSRDIAMQYKAGLEKIGVLCEIKPPVETELESNQSVTDEKKKRGS